MSALRDSVLSYVQSATDPDGNVIFDGYTFQAEWDEASNDANGNYVIIQNNGGAKAKPWFREPNFRIVIVNGRSASMAKIDNDASNFIEFVRNNYFNDIFGMIETVSDSSVIGRTAESRPITEVSLRTFTRH